MEVLSPEFRRGRCALPFPVVLPSQVSRLVVCSALVILFNLLNSLRGVNSPNRPGSVAKRLDLNSLSSRRCQINSSSDVVSLPPSPPPLRSRTLAGMSPSQTPSARQPTLRAFSLLSLTLVFLLLSSSCATLLPRGQHGGAVAALEARGLLVERQADSKGKTQADLVRRAAQASFYTALVAFGASYTGACGPERREERS